MRLLTAAALATLAVPLSAEPETENLVADGIPAIPAELRADAGHHLEFSDATFHGCLMKFIAAMVGLSLVPWCAAEVELKPDLVYGTGGGRELHLDYARDVAQTQPAPCIVVIHGGAWRAGDKADPPVRECIRRLAAAGYVAVSVEYRLIPQALFPAQVEDVKCAVRYLRAHAAELRIKPDAIGAMGFSAGAHLAMMLGTTDAKDGLEGSGGWPDQSSRVAAVVSFFGPTALAATDLSVESQQLVRDFIGGTPAEKPEQFRAASPVTHVSPGDAPVLLFQGTKDPLVPHTQVYPMIEAMTKAGVPGRAELLAGAGHGWGGPELEQSLAATHTFFGRYLRR